MKQPFAHFFVVALIVGVFLCMVARGTCPPIPLLKSYVSTRFLSIVDEVTGIAPTSLIGTWRFPQSQIVAPDPTSYVLAVLLPLPDDLTVAPMTADKYGLYVYEDIDSPSVFSASQLEEMSLDLLSTQKSFFHFKPCSGHSPTSTLSSPLALPNNFSGKIQIAIIPYDGCLSFLLKCSTTSFPLSRSHYPYVVASIEINKIYSSSTVSNYSDVTFPSVKSDGIGAPNLPPFDVSFCPQAKLATGEIITSDMYDPTTALMCSTPTSGGWKQYLDASSRTAVCDCPCIGYWIDNPTTTDNLKCTKCGLQCPDLMSPNADCSGCECSSDVCKRYNRYVHTLIYLEPELLELFTQILSSNPPNPIFPDPNNTLDQIALSKKFLSNPTTYQQTIFHFNDRLAGYLLKLMQQPHVNYFTIVNSVSIRPLVYGSFRVWKVTLDIDCRPKDFSPQSNFGMPPGFSDPETIRTTFFNAIKSHLPTFNQPLTNYVKFATPSQGSIFYVDDHIETFCALQSQDASTLDYNLAKNQKCPSPQDYALFNSEDTAIPESQQYWSPCQYSAVQSFASLTQPPPSSSSTTGGSYCIDLLPNFNISISSLKPVCFDFSGMNLATYGVACGWNGPLVFNSLSQTLVLPRDSITYLGEYLLQNPKHNEASYDIITEVIKHFPLSFPSLPQIFDMICPASTISTSTQTPVTVCPPKMDITGNETIINSIDMAMTDTNFTILTPAEVPATELSGLRTTPTTFSPRDVLHISWTAPVSRDTEFIPLQLSMVTTKENKGSGTFLWSQSLTSSVASTQYVHAQVPSTDSSLLFHRISLDSSLKDKYGDAMQVQAKVPNSSIAPLSIASALTFNFPSLCTAKSISCADPISQYCNQVTARCLCRPGFDDESQTSPQALEYTYDPETGFTDGSALSCIPICQNGGQYKEASGKCLCISGFFGPTCQIVAQCNPASMYTAITATTDSTASIIDTTTFIHKTCNNGYLTLQATCGTDTSSCKCLPNWDNTVLNDQINSRCDICQLNPLTPTITSNDLLYTQAYTPSQFQQCYAAGTDEKSYTPGNCQRCQCKRGFTGTFCQLHEFYIAVNFTSSNTYDYDPATQFLFEDKLRHELSNSFQRSVGSKEITQDMIRLVELSFTNRYWIAGIRSGVDFFLKNAHRTHQFILLKEQRDELLMQEQTGLNTISIQSMLSLQTQIKSLEHTMNLLQSGSETAPGDFSDLFDQWDKLQSEYDNSNVGSQDVNDYLNDGSSSNQNTPISNPYDPSCAVYYSGCSATTQDSFDVWKTAPVDPQNPEETNTTPPSSSKASSTTLIIAVVVSISAVVIFFIVVTVVMIWAKKNQKLFWKPKTKKSKVDDVELSVASSPASKTGSMTAFSSSPTSISTTDTMLSETRIPVEDSSLPSDWDAFQGAGQGEIFYVNKITLQSQWTHPISGASTKSASAW